MTQQRRRRRAALRAAKCEGHERGGKALQKRADPIGSTGMEDAPCIPAAPRRAAAPHCFRLPRRHGRRKVHVVRLGSGNNNGRVQARGRGGGLRLRRWLSRAVWRLAELCVAALASGAPPPGGEKYASRQPCPWAGIEPCFAAPFVPVALMKRARN